MTIPTSRVNAVRQVLDHLRTGEDHVGGVAVLTELVVDPGADGQVLRVADLVGGHDPGPGGPVGVEALAHHHGGRPPLPVPHADVVDHGEPGHHLEGPVGGHVAAPPPDDHAQLPLVVDRGGDPRAPRWVHPVRSHRSAAWRTRSGTPGARAPARRCGRRSCGRWPETTADRGTGAVSRDQLPGGAAAPGWRGAGQRPDGGVTERQQGHHVAGKPDGRIGEVDHLVADHQAGHGSSRPSCSPVAQTERRSAGPTLGPWSTPSRPTHHPTSRRLRPAGGAGHRLLVGDRGGHRPPVRRVGRHRGHQFVDVGGGRGGAGRRAPRRQLRPGRRGRRGPGPTPDRRGGPRHGRLDVLVNNAGTTEVIPHGDLAAATPDVWRRIFDINVIGTWQVTVAAVDPPARLRAGPGGQRLLGGRRATDRQLDPLRLLEGGGQPHDQAAGQYPGSRHPGQRGGAGAGRHPVDGRVGPDPRECVNAQAPLQRTATPEDVAEVILGLARSTYVTGEVVLVDGGLPSASEPRPTGPRPGSGSEQRSRPVTPPAQRGRRPVSRPSLQMPWGDSGKDGAAPAPRSGSAPAAGPPPGIGGSRAGSR